MAIYARQFCKSLEKNNYLEIVIMPFELTVFLLNVMDLSRIICFPFHFIPNGTSVSCLLHSILNYWSFHGIWILCELTHSYTHSFIFSFSLSKGD